MKGLVAVIAEFIIYYFLNLHLLITPRFVQKSLYEKQVRVTMTIIDERPGAKQSRTRNSCCLIVTVCNLWRIPDLFQLRLHS